MLLEHTIFQHINLGFYNQYKLMIIHLFSPYYLMDKLNKLLKKWNREKIIVTISDALYGIQIYTSDLTGSIVMFEQIQQAYAQFW